MKIALRPSFKLCPSLQKYCVRAWVIRAINSTLWRIHCQVAASIDCCTTQVRRSRTRKPGIPPPPPPPRPPFHNAPGNVVTHGLWLIHEPAVPTRSPKRRPHFGTSNTHTHTQQVATSPLRDTCVKSSVINADPAE